ncbi:MAG TPA: metal-binding protein [Thermoplasmatales archaeon]|nr:metal-binding protein [Thermoplasmatales archaeon]
MHKEGIIQLHTLFYQVVQEISRRWKVEEDALRGYYQFGVFPHHVHRSMQDHEKALFMLGQAVARFLSTDKYSGLGKTAERLAKIMSARHQ